MQNPLHRRLLPGGILLCLLLATTACRRKGFPEVPAGYHEFAYVTNGAGNSVSVLDLVYLRQDHILQVGVQPSALAVNPVRNEVYVVNTQPHLYTGSVSVIDTAANKIVATIPVHRSPVSIAIDPTGHRAYVANSASNTVSVIDLDKRRAVFSTATGEQPTLIRIAPDGRTLVAVNHASGSISLYDTSDKAPLLKLRATYDHCAGASDAAILPDSSKVFVSCTGARQVMAVALSQPAGSWPVRQDAAAAYDHMLALLDVGEAPGRIATKPDGGEIFVSNTGSDTISEIDAYNNQVGGTYPIGNKPAQGLVSGDNATLWVAASGTDSISLYSIEDGKLEASLHTGSGPEVLAFSADEHLLLAADSHSGDVAVIRTQGQNPGLFTMLPAGPNPNAIVIKAMQEKQ